MVASSLLLQVAHAVPLKRASGILPLKSWCPTCLSQASKEEPTVNGISPSVELSLVR